jgi:hypothetical protein
MIFGIRSIRCCHFRLTPWQGLLTTEETYSHNLLEVIK